MKTVTNERCSNNTCKTHFMHWNAQLLTFGRVSKIRKNQQLSSLLLTSLSVLSLLLFPTLSLSRNVHPLFTSLFVFFFPLYKHFHPVKILILLSIFLLNPCFLSIRFVIPSLKENILSITNHPIGLYPLSHMSPSEYPL